MGWVRRPRGGRGWEARSRGSDGRERSRSFRTKADAQRFLAGVEAQLQRGDWRDAALARTTFAEWAAEWMATTLHLRPSTKASYEYLLRVHVLPRFGPCQLGRITPVDVRAWLSELKGSKLSPSTVRKAFAQPASTACASTTFATPRSLLLSTGAHPRALMERLGHSSITVTLGRYGHLLPGQDEAIADRLDRAHRWRESPGRGEVVQLQLGNPGPPIGC